MTPDLDLWPIGNCQVSALVDRAGRFVWGCVPRVDGEPVFSALVNTRDDNQRGIWSKELSSSSSQAVRVSRPLGERKISPASAFWIMVMRGVLR